MIHVKSKSCTESVSHWQLRHYLSHPEKDVLYYACGKDIFHLNPSTRKRKHIARLPFDARCTASGHGFVCVGGEKEDDGIFAVIKIDSRHAAVDAPLQLDSSLQDSSSTPCASSIKVIHIGGEIVNSISIHKIHDVEAHLYDLVAVLTNNDRTVRVYSLLQGVETTVLHMPFSMNHATISPDGKSLAAVGDKNCVFLYKRFLCDDPPQIPKPHNRLDMSSVSWQPLHDLELHVPDFAQKGYFTTAWSPSGHLLAVGSEAGHITIIDIDLLHKPHIEDAKHAIVGVVQSSRPNMSSQLCPGAVRCMLFAPDPWDLLIWAEDQGRVCIGDLRDGLRTRQIVELDPKSVSLHRRRVDEIFSEDETDYTRLAELDFGLARDDQYPYQDVEHHISNNVEGASQGDDAPMADHIATLSEMLESEPALYHNDPQGLTAYEQQVLESLRSVRQREEARAPDNVARSVTYATSAHLAERRQHAQEHDRGQAPSRPANEEAFPALSRVNATTPMLMRGQPNVPASSSATSERDTQLQTWLLERHQSHQREHRDFNSRYGTNRASASSARRDLPRESSAWQPRRRQSVVIGQPSNGRMSTSLTLPQPPSQPTIDPQTRTADPSVSLDETPWQTISNAMSVARGPLFEPHSDMPALVPATAEPLQDDRWLLLERQRERLRDLQRSLRETASAADDSATLEGQYELLREATRAVRGLQVSYDILGRRALRPVAPSGSTSLIGREVGVRTAGLALSEDGRLLWIATEEGIFEVRIKVLDRLVWSARDLV